MGFIPYDYRDGQPEPWEYKQAGALGEVEPGLAMVLAEGKLAKCTGTTRPDYIGMFKGTVADGDILPVIRVHEETRFETENSVENAGAVPGARVTIDTTGTMITATTGGAAEISEVIDTAAGGKMIVRFPRVAG